MPSDKGLIAHALFPDSNPIGYQPRYDRFVRLTMAQSKEAVWHFQCPECGIGDGELGHHAADTEIQCYVCLEETGREVTLQRWEVPQARLRLVAA
jgi:hypothetical protein